MRPMMKDIITVLTPTGEVDRFGKAITTETITTARVAPLLNVIEGTDGNKINATAEIDLPPEIIVGNTTRIKYLNQFKKETEATVLRLDYTPDLANKVLFWTVQVG